jgi:putative restriction endonuclease
VSWNSVRQEPRPVHHLDKIVPLLPRKYSTLNPNTGFGNQKAYLAEISEELFNSVIFLTGGQLAVTTPACDTDKLIMLTEEVEAKEIYQDLELSDTERTNQISARWGQGIFRESLLALDGACVITGITDPRLLRASHIKPWRLCKTATDRLSPLNGLLLVPTLDHLFDRGLMTFDGEGRALISQTLSPADAEKLGFVGATAKYPLDIHAQYLAFHRSEIFIS